MADQIGVRRWLRMVLVAGPLGVRVTTGCPCRLSGPLSRVRRQVYMSVFETRTHRGSQSGTHII